MLRSKKMYDICFRAVQGLPLPARALTKLFIESILGRLLRSEDVIVCGYVWMSNHPHMQLFSLDCTALTHLHERLKKRLTDFLKRLLNLSRLNLWDGPTSIGEVLDVDAAIERIVYSFLNPVRAGLVRSIDDYQGCNTWKEFISVPPDTNATVEKDVPWIAATDIPALSRANPSSSEERSVIERITRRAKSKQTNTLRIMPLKWLEAFKITDPVEVEKIRQKIIARVREEEGKLRQQKIAPPRLEGFLVSNVYVPNKKDRRIFMYGSTKRIRIEFLRLYERFAERCRRCYERMKQGATDILWPPECFIPPRPRLCNAF